MPALTVDDVANLRDELLHELSNLDEEDAIQDAGSSVLSVIQRCPSAVRDLAHKKLHAYPFKDVPLCWRRAYEEACLWEIVTVLSRRDGISGNPFDLDSDWQSEIVRLCDNAVIFAGAPKRRDAIDGILGAVDDQTDGTTNGNRHAEVADAQRAKRSRLDPARHTVSIQAFPKPDTPHAIPNIDQEKSIPRLYRPSLNAFSKHIHSSHTPVILRDTISHWPALTRWTNPEYWLARTHGGRRLVPVELGRSYTDEGWGQRIMTFGEYLRVHVLEVADRVGDGLESNRNSSEAQSKPEPEEKLRKGYLAQHDLLSQIPRLRNDIAIPDYCYIDTPDTTNAATNPGADLPPIEPQLNIWLGPAGTISPAHTDPHENILAQVVGRKYVRLFAPGENARMCPMGYEKVVDDEGVRKDNGDGESTTLAVDMQNTSRVDVGAFVSWHSNGTSNGEEGVSAAYEEQRRKFPEHDKAQYVEGVLEAGDCLYVPKGWWHYIHSLDASCSVSFWWD